MRLRNKTIAFGLASLSAIAALAGCAASGAGSGPETAGNTAVNGPAADYPITVGLPYRVDGVTYTPTDIWNYDEVGIASVENAGGETISASNHVLPLPSYVEVTSLETGKTILVRIERRGPLENHNVIALSPGAASQLGISRNTPVRVRRVNPQEPERAALRAGNRAPDRMDTPMSLVEVLKLKLPSSGPAASLALPKDAAAAAQGSTPAVAPATGQQLAAVATAQPSPPAVPTAAPAQNSAVKKLPTPVQRKPDPELAAAPKPAASVAPKAEAKAVAKPSSGAFVVQAGAFSTKDRADKVAKAIGGDVSKTGSLFRVRTGPFATRNAAEASLAKVKAAGYSDARIYSGGQGG
ncbi:SPOR domain-containing protein [Altererythrobacter fulvus]|uniref:SPOR domain-containing protein n=1 Tax=Caenibius fulvus TaxID=2126012 RepID=UPI003015CAC3